MKKDKLHQQKRGSLTLEELSAILEKQGLTTTGSNVERESAEKSERALYNQVGKIFSSLWNENLDPDANWDIYSLDHPVVLLKNLSQEKVEEAVVEICRHDDLLNGAWELGMNALGNCLGDNSLRHLTVSDVLNGELLHYEDVERFDTAADELVAEMMSLWQTAQNVPEIMDICTEFPAFADFNPGKRTKESINNYRKWHHTQTEVGSMLSLDVVLEDTCPDPEAERAIERVINDVAYVQLRESFYATLNDLDKEIFCLRERGYSQTEIARILGFESQGTVSKRLRKLKEKFQEFISSI